MRLSQTKIYGRYEVWSFFPILFLFVSFFGGIFTREKSCTFW
jgi:hypothetical protein